MKSFLKKRKKKKKTCEIDHTLLWTKLTLVSEFEQQFLMRMTRTHYLDEVNTNDEVIPSDEEISHHWRGKESHSMMPVSSLSSYETSKTGHWEPNKSPIIGLEALLREALTLQRLATKITYIKLLHWQHKVHILIFWENTYYFSSLANCFSVLTLASEVLW